MVKLVTNKGLIELNQDPEARPAYYATNQPWGQDRIVLARLLAGGDIAIGFFNLSEDDSRIYLYTETMGIPDAAGVDLKVRDVITGEDCGVWREFADPLVPKHDCRVFRATPVWR